MLDCAGGVDSMVAIDPAIVIPPPIRSLKLARVS